MRIKGNFFCYFFPLTTIGFSLTSKERNKHYCSPSPYSCFNLLILLLLLIIIIIIIIMATCIQRRCGRISSPMEPQSCLYSEVQVVNSTMSTRNTEPGVYSVYVYEGRTMSTQGDSRSFHTDIRLKEAAHGAVTENNLLDKNIMSIESCT